MPDHPLSRERAQTVAYAIRNGEPYEPIEAADLLDFLSAEIRAGEATARNVLSLIAKGKYRVARALLTKISGDRT